MNKIVLGLVFVTGSMFLYGGLVEHQQINQQDTLNLGLGNSEKMNSNETGLNHSPGNDFKIQFSLECLDIPDMLVQLHAKITFGYLMRIDEKGRPIDIDVLWMNETIKSLLGGVLDSDEVILCMKLNWRFTGLNHQSPITVLIRWEDEMGFVQMIIFNDRFNCSINLNPSLSLE